MCKLSRISDITGDIDMRLDSLCKVLSTMIENSQSYEMHKEYLLIESKRILALAKARANIVKSRNATEGAQNDI